MSEPTWDHYRSLLAVLDEGSLSGAARALGLTQPTLARHIEQLEQSLGGAALFTRSPRGLQPTDAAAALEPHARTMAAAAAALTRAASGAAEAVEGAVRITASEVIGGEVLPGILRDLSEQHPLLAFELVLSDRTADLLRRDADIAVRMVRPTQNVLLARKVGAIWVGLYAHRAYLARHGAPDSFDDLARHAFIGFDQDTVMVEAARAGGLTLTRDMFRLRTDNDLAQINAVRAGFGIGGCQIGLAKRDPDLVRVLPAFALPLETWIVMHEDLRAQARMRATFDHLVDAMTAYARTSVG